jgi:glycosyltransferase involved in cell wall biosynthesis
MQTFKNYRNVLVIPNITNSKNPEMDSFFDVLNQQIIKLGSDFYWYIPVIKPVKLLTDKQNVKQIPINLSGNMFHMRVSFPIDMIKLLQSSTLSPNKKTNDLWVDYDVVYSHLPDWNIRRFVPNHKPIIGYAHWWEMEICNGKSNLNNYLNFEREILGALQMKILYVNTKTQKTYILKEASKTFNSRIIEDLDRIIQPFYLTIPENLIIKEIPQKRERTILFNHRCTPDKGYSSFVKQIFKFREIRQDFKVWFTQAEKYSILFIENWIQTHTIDSKNEYYEEISNCWVTIVPSDSHFGWNISAMDSLMRGTPVLLEECENYRELFPNGLFYSNQSELFELLNRLLDDEIFYHKWVVYSINHAKILSNNKQYEELKQHLLF